MVQKNLEFDTKSLQSSDPKSMLKTPAIIGVEQEAFDRVDVVTEASY